MFSRLFVASDSERYCRHILQTADFDRYIATLFIPKPKRSALTALWAFHYEMARIADHAKQPLMGEIRLRWWCDAIDEINDHMSEYHAAENPLLFAVGQAICQFDLPKHILVSVCEAHIERLYEPVLPNSKKFENYGHETAGCFFALACQILMPKQIVLTAPSCFHAGQADILWRYWRRQEARGIHTEARDQMVATLQEHYDLLLKEMATLPRTLRLAFLSLAPIGIYLRLFHGKKKTVPDMSSLRHLWLIGHAALTGHFSRP